MIEFCKTPIYEAKLPQVSISPHETKAQAYFSLLMVYHDVVGLDIPVHDPFAVAKVQRLEELKDIVPHVVVNKLRIEASEVRIVDIFKYQGRRLALAVSDHVQQRNHIWSARQILQDLDLALYLLFLDWLQDFDDTFLIVDNVDPFKDL